MPMYRTQPSSINLDGFNEGLSAIGKAFAPPTPQEIAVSQRAAADARKAAAVQRIRGGSSNTGDYVEADVSDPARQSAIADMISRARQPGANPRGFDAENYVVYGNAGNTFAGIDVNNAAQMARTKVEQQGALARAMVGPLPAGATRYTPKTIGDVFGGVPEVQTGVVDVSPGNRATLADGRVIEGAPKPESTDEVMAAILRSMPRAQQEAKAFGSTPTPTISTPNGPRIVTAPESLGQAPAPDAAAKPDLRNYKDGDRTGAARFDPSQGWVDAQTGQKLSQAVQLYSSQLQGNAADTGLGTTAKNGVEGQMVDLANLESVVNQFDDLIKRDPSAIGTTGRVLGFGQDLAATAQEVTGLLTPKLQAIAKDAERGLVDPEVMAKNFNPNIPQAQLLENLLVAQLAKVNDPNGRLSNQAMDQTRAALGGGGLFQNAQRTRAALDGIRQQISAKRGMYKGIAPEAAALGPGPAGAPAPVSSGPAEGTVIENDAGQRMIRRGGKWEPSNG